MYLYIHYNTNANHAVVNSTDEGNDRKVDSDSIQETFLRMKGPSFYRGNNNTAMVHKNLEYRLNTV